MDTTHLPPDFREFLRLLNANQVEYLLVGGYAVGHYGYVRNTANMDVWVAISPENSTRVLNALEQFGFDRTAGAHLDLFQQPGNTIRMGEPPLRIEIQTEISGVTFAECYARRVDDTLDSGRHPRIHHQSARLASQQTCRRSSQRSLQSRQPAVRSRTEDRQEFRRPLCSAIFAAFFSQ